MTEYEGLYTAVVRGGPKEIERNLAKIGGIHQQEALDSALEKAITLSVSPKIQNIRHLLKLGADANGPTESAGTALSYAYSAGLNGIIELLLKAGADPNAAHSNVLEQAVRKDDSKYVVRFVEAGADINDKSKLLFTDDLLTATSDPEIKKYLLSKGLLHTATPELEKQLADVRVLKLSDFDYGSAPALPEQEPEEMYIEDYSARFCLVRGNTKEHQDLLRRHGGRFLGGKGWLVPASKRATLQEAITILQATPVKSESPGSVEPETPETPEEDLLIKKITSSTSITRPILETPGSIDLFTPHGEYGYLTLSFTRPKLFCLDQHCWDSVERYLMYKMYEGSFKGKAIKEAETLAEARRKFNVNAVSTAKTPKQLVLNQKLLPLARSETNSGYLQHREQLFYRGNKAKFDQNRLYRNKLLTTDAREILNKNFHDLFGYEGNLLGNTLMKLRHEYGGAEYNQRNVSKTNSLIIEQYPGNKNFYVIRGDPDADLSAEIRGLGTYRTKHGKVIRGKLNLNLQGGAGWLIPLSKKKEAKGVVFDTFPDQKKIEVFGRDWVKKHMQRYLEIAILFSRFRERQEVGADDLLFSIKDVFGGEDFLGEKGDPGSDRFVHSVWRYADQQDVVISDAAIQLLWEYMSKVVLDSSKGIETYQQMKETIKNLEGSILDTPIKPIEGLTERESIVVDSFARLFRLLKKINNTETKVCVTVIHMILSKHHYEQVRELYAKKTKMQGDSEYPNEETQYRRRFHIKSPHIQAVLDQLPRDISKKCRLLVLTALDYIMGLEGEDAIAVSKRLILLSQKGKQPSPTPKTPTPAPVAVSDIPKPEDVADKTPENPETPPFEGTPDMQGA